MSVVTSAHSMPRTGPFSHGPLRTWPARLGVLLVVTALTALAGVTWQATRQPTAVTYRTEPVKRATVTQTVSVSGSLAAAPDQIRMFFSASGRIVQIGVAEGDKVTAGQVLATLDTRDLQNAVTQAQVNVQSAQAKYDQTITGATAQDIALAKSAVDTAQRGYADTQKTTGNDVAAAEQALTKLTSSYRDAQIGFSLLTDGIETDITTFTTAIDGARSIVWTTITDFKTKSTADITTARTAVGQADAALSNAQTYSTNDLATALAEWLSARDGVISAWLQFDGATARGTDTSGAASSFLSAERAYGLAAAHLSAALDPPSAAISSAQTNVSAAQAAMGSNTSLVDPGLDLVRADLSGLQAALVTEVELATTVKAKVTDIANGLATIDGAIGGGYASALQTVGSAKDKAAQSVSAQEAALRQAQLSLAKTAAPPLQTDIAIAYASVQLAQLALDTAQQDLDDATLRAPVAGVVASVDGQVGDLVSASASSPFLLLDPSGAMQLQGTVGEANVGKLQAGQKANVTIAAVPGVAVSSTVASIDRTATISQGVPVYNVAIAVASPPPAARVGMTATAQVVLATKPDVLTVSNLAIRSQAGRRYVQVLTGGVPTDTTVEFGITSGTVTEVVSGLHEGDLVVLPAPTVTATARPAGGGGVNVPGLRP